MIVAGIQKSSLIDYPGLVSCVLFTRGCNFRCPYCHNPSLVIPSGKGKRGQIAEEEVMAFLHRRKGLLGGVVISGGEPTLHGDLVRFCRRIKQMGYPVKLDTNGSRPKVLAGLIEKSLVDYIAMDIKTLPENYPVYIKKGVDPQPVLDSMRLIMASGKPYEFRTTCAKPMITTNGIEKIARLIENARLYVLQPFVPGEILYPDFFDGKRKNLYQEEDLNRFRVIAEKWVNKCYVRI